MEPTPVIAPDDVTRETLESVRSRSESHSPSHLPLPDAFVFCPQCGMKATEKGSNPFQCRLCGFRLFFGPTVAVAAIVTDHHGRILFLKRAHEPGKGKLGIPGGFVDVGEGVEEALIREVFEETNLEVVKAFYIASFPNSYAYRGLLYPVTDVFFRCEIDSLERLKTQPSEVADHLFLHPTPKDLEQMAFDSNRRAVERFLASQS